MLGGFAGAVIFVCGMLGWFLLATSLCAYAGYCIVVVVTDTASGVDEVRWPADSMIDWIGQSIRFFILFGTLLIPLGFLLRIVGDSFHPDDPVTRFFVLSVLWLWLTFPIALLSSMSAGHPYAIIHPGVLRDLFRISPTVMVFYIKTGAGASVVAYLWYASLLGRDTWLMPLAAVASGAGLLVYARLIGRLGWLTVQLGPWRRKRPIGKLRPTLRKQMRVTDPWAAPVVEKKKPEPIPKPKPIPKQIQRDDDDEDGPATPYGLNNDAPCRPPKLELIEGTYLLDVKLAPARPFSELPPLPPQPPRYV